MFTDSCPEINLIVMKEHTGRADYSRIASLAPRASNSARLIPFDAA
jgi:hypothetical protein